MKFKATYTRTGSEQTGYGMEKTYECGNWIIGRSGMYSGDIFIYWAGDWNVSFKDEMYGSFSTKKSAIEYIKNWVKINPQDV